MSNWNFLRECCNNFFISCVVNQTANPVYVMTKMFAGVFKRLLWDVLLYTTSPSECCEISVEKTLIFFENKFLFHILGIMFQFYTTWIFFPIYSIELPCLFVVSHISPLVCGNKNTEAPKCQMPFKCKKKFTFKYKTLRLKAMIIAIKGKNFNKFGVFKMP